MSSLKQDRKRVTAEGDMWQFARSRGTGNLKEWWPSKTPGYQLKIFWYVGWGLSQISSHIEKKWDTRCLSRQNSFAFISLKFWWKSEWSIPQLWLLPQNSIFYRVCCLRSLAEMPHSYGSLQFISTLFRLIFMRFGREAENPNHPGSIDLLPLTCLLSWNSFN